ncbi:hypothetical protein [Planktosalinus lacus]|uniref:Uncharacterized protein n=1 Tax=Planktosalinus lacus TaxID=1526573 RepID=A0A8J2Y863_9FLAO|nr:hypothetical protein [Planktosalinus lacus]GGD84892.1 hypothetical protein GCM10011312_06160 [Planktosalinus lacus]
METIAQTLPKHPFSCLSVELIDVVKTLKSKLDIRALYCFGLRQQNGLQTSFIVPGTERAQQRIHLDLLVIPTKIPPRATTHLSALIEKQTRGRYNVSLLLHTPSQVRAATSKNGFLFHNILKQGRLLYAHPSWNAVHSDTRVYSLKASHVKKITTRRLYNAQQLFQLEDAITGVEGGHLRVSLMRSGLEQLCLAIIYACLGYHPNQFHLDHLFSLCAHCTPLVNEVFPNETEEDQAILSMLHTSPQSLRAMHPKQFTHTQLLVLVERCYKLYSKTETLLRNQIAGLQT